MKARSILGAVAALACFACDDTPNARPDSGPADAAADAGTQMDASAADTGAGDSGVANDAGTATSSICPAGAALVQYSFSPVDPLPARSEINLPNLLSGAEILSAGSSGEYSVRFDLCDEGGGLTLRGILYSGYSFETPSFYVRDDSVSAPVEQVVELEEGLVVERRLPPSMFLVDGLAEALQGNLQNFRVRLLGESGLWLQGHDGFIALASGRVGESTIEYTSIYVVVGGLVPGDVFENLQCRFGEAPFAKTFTMSTATFEVEACTFLGGGETTGYRINFLAIQDSSPELTEAERARFEYTPEAEVESVLNYQWNHHNACDSFHLALPHADYAASTSPLAGCGTTVPNAPMRSFDEDPSSPVQFRIRYHGGAWVDGVMTGCSHYLFCR